MDFDRDRALDARLEEIARELYAHNGRYAVAVEEKNSLLESIAPLLEYDRDLTICWADCANFRDYLDRQETASALLLRETYRRGNCDCAGLLRGLGIFS